MPVGGSISATFNVTVAAATITSTSFELRDASNALVPAAVTYSAETRTATLTPASALAASTQYTARLRGGAGGQCRSRGQPAERSGPCSSMVPPIAIRWRAPQRLPRCMRTRRRPTSSPAVTVRSVGTSGGQVAAFTYDLARSVVYTRQGNPAWAGQERDGQAPIRPDDLFFGGSQPDWVDLTKVAIPQADEQQRLLANLIQFMNADRKPIPRFWYLPRGLKAAVVMTGDDHGFNGTPGRFDIYQANSPAGCSVANWECVRATSYIDPVDADQSVAGGRLRRERVRDRRAHYDRLCGLHSVVTGSELRPRSGGVCDGFSRRCPHPRRTAPIASPGVTTAPSQLWPSRTESGSTPTTTTGRRAG